MGKRDVYVHLMDLQAAVERQKTQIAELQARLDAVKKLTGLLKRAADLDVSVKPTDMFAAGMATGTRHACNEIEQALEQK